MRRVFVNGRIYTAEHQAEATAFVIEDNKFIYVGSDEEALKLLKEGDEIRNLQEVRVIPGMMDSHAHYLALCTMDLEAQIEIDYYFSHEQVLNFVKGIAKLFSVEELPVINGIGYGPSCIPLATELDKAVDDRPVFLLDSGGHSGWMNTKMMELARLDSETADPIPGVSYYSRDENGNPNGQVTETAVMNIEAKTGLVDAVNVHKELPEMIKTIHSLGVTSVFDASMIFLKEREVLKTLATLESSVQFFTSFHYFGTEGAENFLQEMISLRDEYTRPWLHPTTLKLFKDGTIEAQTALLFDDYLLPGKGHGGEVLTHEQMLEISKLAAAEGFNIHTHAIGDKAIDMTLKLYKQLGDIEGTKTIAHVQVLPEDGIEQFSEQSEVFYQTTPIWLANDPYTEEVLGRERVLREMPLRSISDKGVRLSFGSDAPVSGGAIGMNPFLNMHYAVNRAFDEVAYAPPQSEGIDIRTCLDAYTINGAMQVGAQDFMGSIAPGKRADFVILDRDILSIDPEEIKETEVLETWSGGHRVYQRS